MSKWATSILAMRNERDGSRTVNHCACVIIASSLDEATGKARRIALKLYPIKDGWERYDTISQDVALEIDDPEDAKITS